MKLHPDIERTCDRWPRPVQINDLPTYDVEVIELTELEFQELFNHLLPLPELEECTGEALAAVNLADTRIYLDHHGE